MRRFVTALIAMFVLALLGPVAVAFASVPAQGGGEDNPVTGAAASDGTNGGTGGSQPDTGGGGGGQDAGGATSTAQSETNGPAEGPSHVQGSNSPTQDTSSSSDATVDNGAGVDQSSVQGVIGSADEHGHAASSSQGDVTGQGQGEGQAQGPGNGNGNDNGNGNGLGNGHGQGQQQAHAGQQANASAAAVTSGSTNDANTVLVGPAAAGDNGATLQTNTAMADADATVTHEATQNGGDAPATTATEGETTSQAGAEQSATATAQAQATDPENVAITTRIEAPGDDGPVEQSNVISANAEAVTQSQGSETTQQANAASKSQLESPANVAVELRVFSGGDFAGGEQINSSSAAANTITDGLPGQASADATLTDPNNTFVSIRVNSEGMTGAVEQENLTQESANGVISATSNADHRTAWSGADAESGVAIGLTTDGDNTDLRITVVNETLDRPSEGTTFTWTWDLVVGEDGLACDVQSSSEAGRVDWNFDCDPNDLITREPGSEPTLVVGAVSWNWDWSRPDLEGWDWSRQDTIVLPDCSGCTYVIDFRWITLEPVAPAAAAAENEATREAEASPVSVHQSNVASASASATAGSGISQALTQTSEGGSDRAQSALQDADIVQSVTATAAAELTNPTNQVIVSHGLASQWNWVEVVVSADAAALIRQHAEQHQFGNGSLQVQVVLQSAQFTQLVTAIGAAAVRDGSNRTISRHGNGIQSTSSKALGTGRAGASAEQLIVQVQVGNDSEQLQVAGQWAIVVQHVDLGAASALAIGVNGSRLDNDTMNQRIGVASSSQNTATATITQTAIQLQDADGLTQIQESLQLAQVEQIGIALAKTDSGRIEHWYATAPAAPPVVDGGSTQTVSTVGGTTRIVVIDSNGATEISVTGVPTPSALPAQPSIVNLPSPDADNAELVGVRATVFRFSQVLAPARGPLAGTKGAEKAGGSSPRFPGSAPEHHGAAAASAGTGGPGAIAALAALSLLRTPRRGRRVFSSAGRRPTAALLRRERPG
jgi:hypothetical protein